MQLLIKCTVLSASMLTIVLPQRLAVACGININSSEYRFWLLQPDLSNEAELTPFYFSGNYLYNGDMYAGIEYRSFPNTAEWAAQLDQDVEEKDIDGLLEYTPPTDYFENAALISDTNSFMRALLLPKNKDLHRYITLSKQLEQIAANPDPWEEEIFPEEHIQAVIRSARGLYHSTGSEFVKMRTGYQLIRLHSKNKQYDSMETVYKQCIAGSKMKTWIRSGALYQLAINTPGPKGDYLMSKVFDRGDYNRVESLVHFNSENMDSILPFAKNTHERNVLLAMKTFNYKGRSLHFLQQLNRSEPKYKELPFLILREINKVEDWIMTTKLTHSIVPASYNLYNPAKDYENIAARVNYNNDKAYAQKLYNFIAQIIAEKKSIQIPLLHLYAAHLSVLLENPQTARFHLDEATKGKNLLPTAKTQIRVERFLLQLETDFNTKAENELLKILHTPDDKLGVYSPDIMKNQLILYTGQKLIKQGHKAQGLMLLSRTNRLLIGGPWAVKSLYQEISDVAGPEDYDEILRTLDKKDKSPFEQFISTPVFNVPSDWYTDSTDERFFYNAHWNRGLLLDCKSTYYIKQHRLAEALGVLKQIPASYWNEYPQRDYNKGNPFFVNIHVLHRNLAEDSARFLNKKETVEEMLRLETIAARDPSKAGYCYFQLANAWFNMSWYGKNWLSVKQWWATNEVYSIDNRTEITRFAKDYYGCEQAAKYYQLAMKNTRDKQLAALSFFMKQECNNNLKKFYFYQRQGHDDYRDYERKNILNKSLARQQKIDLGYYTSLVEECELYQSFTSKYATPISQ